jgi:exonuclease III
VTGISPAVHDIPPKPAGQVRVVTWNIAGAFWRKAAVIDSLDADIAIIQECRYADLSAHRGSSGDFAWIGAENGSGLAVIAGDGWTMSGSEPACADHFFLPTTLSRGMLKFSVLGVWVKPAEDYLAPTMRAIEAASMFAAHGAAIMAGDFNANAVWDRRGRSRTFGKVVERLAAAGLSSAWHQFTGEQHGLESAPTFHLYRAEAKAYHIDYLFLRKASVWEIASVRIGRFEHWIRSGLSDHLPVVLDLRLASAATGG